MTASDFRTSGDLAADRRYAYAAGLFTEGDAAGAADLFAQALELAPDWPAGWFALGEARARLDDRAGAVEAFRRARDLDPADSLGAGLHLVRLGAAAMPDAPPEAYVRGLFDQYAPRFEQALVETLSYAAPRRIAEALAESGGIRPTDHVVDLGCGTGLMAAELLPRPAHLSGVDLSAGMIAIARSKGLYGALDVGDIKTALDALPPGSVDLVTAADVFCYLGDLRPIIGAAARVLRHGGRLAFSVEHEATPSDAGFVLRDSLRYGHTETYVTGLSIAAGLSLAVLNHAVLRIDRGAPVLGLVAVFTRP